MDRANAIANLRALSRLRLSDMRWAPRLLWAYSVATVRPERSSLTALVRRLEGRPGTDARTTAGDARRLTYLTTGFLRRMHGRDFCFPRSLILFHFLSRWGYPVRLFFGVRKEEEQLKGHAWLEVAGVPFAEASDPRAVYHVTYSFPHTKWDRYEDP